MTLQTKIQKCEKINAKISSQQNQLSHKFTVVVTGQGAV